MFCVQGEEICVQTCDFWVQIHVLEASSRKYAIKLKIYAFEGLFQSLFKMWQVGKCDNCHSAWRCESSIF